MSNVLEITKDNFQTEVLGSTIPVLVDFAAEWCGPCKRLAPIIEELAKEFSDSVKVAHVDIDSYPDIATKYSVMSVPTLILYKNGAPVNKSIGLISKSDLIDFIKSNS
ncbi:thioredoxin [bacterium]|nr:thioredoxin [bacterium]MCP5462357.1 thioredoxin [bacterium]